jgi:ubiquinone/menaquinone biosynthesis C-methylase UbiE
MERLVRWYDAQAWFYRLWRNRYDDPLVARAADLLGDGEPGTRMLDAGCGTGLYSIGLARTRPGWEIHGIDASGGMLAVADAQARRLGSGNVSFHRGVVTALPFADGSFDFVVAGGLIPYVNEPVQALREFRRVLRAGGRMVSLEFDRDGMSLPLRAFFHVMIFGFKIVARLLPRFRYAERWNVRTSTIDPRVYDRQLREAGFDIRSVERRDAHLVYDLARENDR